MLILEYSYFFYVLSWIQGHPAVVSAWTLSPIGTTRTTIKNKHSIHKEWERRYRFSFPSKSRLFQDFIDENGDNDSVESRNTESFDDFADFGFVVGDDAAASDDGRALDGSDIDSSSSKPSLSMSILQQRFQKLSLAEQLNRQQVSDNLKEGYWGVWGCSLDPYTGEEADIKTVITCIRQMPTLIDGDLCDNDSTLLVIGRSDGSICWLQMEIGSSSSSLSSSRSTSPSDNDPNNSVENRSITTYFENKLVAKATDDGGMVVDTALQRQEYDSDNGLGEGEGMNNENGYVEGSSPRLPFDILAQIQTVPTPPLNLDGGDAIVDILPIPSVRMVWTISHNIPNVIQGWKLVPDEKTGFLLPSSKHQDSKFDIETIHTSAIIGMKDISKCDDYDESEETLVVSVSDNGQVVVWEVALVGNDSSPSIRILVDANCMQEQLEEVFDESDSILSMDVDDQYLYLGTVQGKILIFSFSAILEKDLESSNFLRRSSLLLVKSFQAFTSRDPSVSALLAVGPGSLGAENNAGNSNKFSRPTTKTLIAGSSCGELKQWELIQVGKDRLEHWPRMASQKLSRGKPHVYKTTDYSFESSGDDQNSSYFSPAIKELLCIQQVLLAATNHDLTAWDSSTGTSLYDMQGLDFALGAGAGYQRPSLIGTNDSVLITNGMENFVCVHDFTMDRITSENAEDYLQRDTDGNGDDDSDDANSFGKRTQNNW